LNQDVINTMFLMTFNRSPKAVGLIDREHFLSPLIRAQSNPANQWAAP